MCSSSFKYELDDWQTFVFQVIQSIAHVLSIVVMKELTKKQLFQNTPCWNRSQSAVLLVPLQHIKPNTSLVLKENDPGLDFICILVFWREEVMHYRNKIHNFLWVAVPTSKIRFDRIFFKSFKISTSPCANLLRDRWCNWRSSSWQRWECMEESPS